MKRSLDNNHKNTPRKQVRFEDSDSEDSSNDVFDLCIMLDHIALKCPMLRDVLKRVVLRHAVPSRAYTKYVKALTDDDRAGSAMEETAAEMCNVGIDSVWDTPEERPEWASQLSYVSIYSEAYDYEEYADELDVPTTARIFIARLRLERSKTLSALRLGTHGAKPELMPVIEDAIASLLPLAPPSCATDSIAEIHKFWACREIEIVCQRCSVLAPCLEPIIASYAIPADAYERAKKDFDVKHSNVADLCSAEASALWEEGETRPEWAKGLYSVCIDSPDYQVTLPVAAYVLLLGIDVILHEDAITFSSAGLHHLEKSELAFYGEIVEALKPISMKDL